MAITINPVTAGQNQTFTSSSAGNTDLLTAFEQIIALRNDQQALFTTGQAQNDNTLLNADLLDLSPQALNVLNGIDTGTPANAVVPQITAPATTPTLTDTQLQQIAAILAPFSNAPFTQDTFTQIQNALSIAGYNPQQFSLQEILLAFNSPLLSLFGLGASAPVLNETLSTDLLSA